MMVDTTDHGDGRVTFEASVPEDKTVAALKKRVAELEGIAKEALLRLPHSRSDCDHYGGESSLCDNCKLVKKFDALSRKDGD